MERSRWLCGVRSSSENSQNSAGCTFCAGPILASSSHAIRELKHIQRVLNQGRFFTNMGSNMPFAADRPDG